ncbi:TetR/AcrR family transcriptional regulator [Brachybacterium sacelli]|uniref:AcrR family transcriptional regulator n=1 Tax=Brachybacterium sacelli TaxID=173364 RepID=A0ABS4X4D6_9MICO|nr:TetR/AcrR family transcriptional regulator [Brachybacterium sacelli]MBP2383323.1 AcrR family transcriptional regulator [Brachybacterium sacelli]
MASGTLSTAESRRPVITSAALRAFSRGGYGGTTVADIARDAGISSAYVFKLFPGKERLFVAAVDACFEQIEATLDQAAAESRRSTPSEILDAMGDAYAELITDRTLLLIQVHAQSVASVPAIGDALRGGLARITRVAKERSGADDAAVQRFIAYGQLCHLIATADIAEVDAEWARTLSNGIRHLDPPGETHDDSA